MFGKCPTRKGLSLIFCLSVVISAASRPVKQRAKIFTSGPLRWHRNFSHNQRHAWMHIILCCAWKKGVIIGRFVLFLLKDARSRLLVVRKLRLLAGMLGSKDRCESMGRMVKAGRRSVDYLPRSSYC
jgi:hypothetical protein